MIMFKKISLYFLSLVFVTTTIGSAFAVTLKASHQWPGTPRADGSFDVRHEMVQIIADEMKKANVGVDIRIYPAKSLYKPKEQWKPMTTGQLDISAFPLAYAAKFHPEFDITLMPGMVKNHKHALRVNASPMMKEIKKVIPNAKLVYNNSPSFNWTLNFRQQVFDAMESEGKDVSAYDRADLMNVSYDDSELAIEADNKIRTFQADAAREAGIFHHLITANLPVDSLPLSLFTWKIYIPNETGKLSDVVRSQYLIPSSIELLCFNDRTNSPDIVYMSIEQLDGRLAK